MERNKAYFTSDAHLGLDVHEEPLVVERRLVRWLDSIKEDAAYLFLLGDMFDYWFEYRHVVPKGFTRFIGKLGNCLIWVSKSICLPVIMIFGCSIIFLRR